MQRGRHAIAALLSVCLFVVLGAVPAQAEGKRAFVVGLNAYPNLGPDAQLQRAGNDAQAVGDALEQIGFTVTRFTQKADLAPLLSSFGQFVSTVNPGDTVVFFFAGHGISLDDGTYLLPSDVPSLKPTDELLAKRATIAEREISGQLRGTGARAALVVLDACRNNPFPPRGTRALGNSTRGLTRMTAADGVFTLYSAREGQTALDSIAGDDNRNSVFTRIFVQTLRKPGVSISELGETVRDDVAMLARSAGHDQVPAVYNDLIGARKLYLAGAPQTPTTVPSEAPAPAPVAAPVAATQQVAALPPAQPPAQTVVQRPVEPEPVVGPMPDWCTRGGPGTRIERIICADPRLGGSDVKLNQVYVARAAKLTGPTRLRFIQDSRDWIRERDARCATGTDAAIRTCLLAAIEERTDALSAPDRPTAAEIAVERPEWCLGNTPKNQIERIICSDPELSRWDVRLNRLYNGTVARLNGQARLRFVRESREWLLDRDARCAGSPVSAIRGCLLAAVQQRAAEIGP